MPYRLKRPPAFAVALDPVVRRYFMERTMDWEKHRFGGGVGCAFTPRETYEGRGLKPEGEALRGKALLLIGMWLMGDDDPYPGEWALGDARGSTVLHDAGLTWIASGDVTPNNQAKRPASAGPI